MRCISVGVPSGTVKMKLWEGTEEEQSFPVKSLKRGRPYVNAYGVKYELTDEEVNYIKILLSVIGE